MVRGAEHKRLDIPRIGAIKSAARLPLTLHGGSGTEEEDFRRAIQAGITMIHIKMEVRVAWRGGIEEALRRNSRAVAPYKVLPEGVGAVKSLVRQRLRLFNEGALSVAGAKG